MKIFVVLLVFSSLGCSWIAQTLGVAVPNDDVFPVADPPKPKPLPPPMTLAEMKEVLDTWPKLECSLSGDRVTLALSGRIGMFNYGVPGMENGFSVCLVGRITEWRTMPEHCREYVPAPDHVYQFGPILLPRRGEQLFSFASVADGIEHRWSGVKWVNPSGACRVFRDKDDNADALMFVKQNGKK